MERLCVSLETAKKLKAAGFPQLDWRKSYYHWQDEGSGKYSLTTTNSLFGFTRNSAIAAPTAQELADELPIGIKVTKNYDSVDETQGYIAWRAPEYGTPEGQPKHKRIGFPGNTMSEALASLYLALQEETK